MAVQKSLIPRVQFWVTSKVAHSARQSQGQVQVRVSGRAKPRVKAGPGRRAMAGPRAQGTGRWPSAGAGPVPGAGQVQGQARVGPGQGQVQVQVQVQARVRVRARPGRRAMARCRCRCRVGARSGQGQGPIILPSAYLPRLSLGARLPRPCLGSASLLLVSSLGAMAWRGADPALDRPFQGPACPIGSGIVGTGIAGPGCPQQGRQWPNWPSCQPIR